MNSQSGSQQTAEIAGGGFAGLVAATALAQRGWSVRVHEMDPQIRNFGAGIFVWENGLRALEAIGALEGIEGRHFPSSVMEDRLGDGTLVSKRDFPLPGGERLVTMTRGTLHSAIAKAALDAGVKMRTDSKIVAGKPEGALIDQSGRAWGADLVIGADGIRSQVRDSLALLRRHEVFPFAVYRFLVPYADARSKGMSRVCNYWDTDKHRRVLFVPCDDEHLYLLLGARENDTEVLRTPLVPELWRHSFPYLSELLVNLPKSPRFDRYEVLSLRRWGEGKVAVMGDAAHAMPPTFGQGAGTAMINAFALATHVSDSSNVETAIESWEAECRPLTDQTQHGTVLFFSRMFSEDRHLNYEWHSAELEAMNFFPSTWQSERS